MCTNVTEIASVFGSAKGARGWNAVDTATVYFDHPYHCSLDHALMIDFTNSAQDGMERVAVELSADSARQLVARILAALENGENSHAADVSHVADVPHAF